MSTARRPRTQMAAALRDAGVRVSVCPVHQAVKPCGHCARAFEGAEKQKRWHDAAEARRLHAEWLAKQGRQ